MPVKGARNLPKRVISKCSEVRFDDLPAVPKPGMFTFEVIKHRHKLPIGAHLRIGNKDFAWRGMKLRPCLEE